MAASLPRNALLATGGLLVWAAEFVFLYAFIALACEHGFARHIGWVGVTSIALAAVVSAYLAYRGVRGSGFVAALAAGTAALALIAIAFIALPVVLLRTC